MTRETTGGLRFDTRLVHAGESGVASGDVVAPVHVSVAYDRDAQDPLRYFYGRGENPTREALEACLASLEDVAHATVFPSGQAAASTALAVLAHDRCVVASDDLYGSTHELFDLLLGRGRVRYADLSDAGVVAGLFAGRSAQDALVWIESPSNPTLKLVDLRDVCDRAHRVGAVVVVDNTLAGPALQQPLRHGADVSIYSTTKGIAGHLDVLGGALVHDRAELHVSFVRHRTLTGNVPGAIDCFLVQRGLRTLAVRVARQVESARAIAAALQASDLVDAVHYPGLPEHPQAELAGRQMAGPGSIIGFRFRGDVAAMLGRLRVFAHAVSLGGVRSLAQAPATATHRALPPEQRLRLGITEDLVRLSVGIEDPRDLLADLNQAMRPAGAHRTGTT